MLDDDEDEEEEEEREGEEGRKGAVARPRQRNAALEEVFGHSDDDEPEEELGNESGSVVGSVASRNEVRTCTVQYSIVYIIIMIIT